MGRLKTTLQLHDAIAKPLRFLTDISPEHYAPALTIKEGHRYFWLRLHPDAVPRNWAGDWRENVLAIADQSGDYPHETDDGLLWVDISTPFTVGERGTIPLIDAAGNRSKTNGGAYEVCAVARQLAQPVLIYEPTPTADAFEQIKNGVRTCPKYIKISAASLYWDNGTAKPEREEE
mgnify:CR=1 FL=1